MNQYFGGFFKLSPQSTTGSIIGACGFHVTDGNRHPAV
jgi:hypothetical protein